MDDLELFKKRLHDLLKNANLPQVLELLGRELKPRTDIREQVALQWARYSENERQHEIGVRDESHYISENNKIRAAFFKLIDNLEKDHLVDDFGKNPIVNPVVNPIVNPVVNPIVNPVVNSEPSKKTTLVMWSQSNLGWIFFFSLIGLFFLSSALGFISVKPIKRPGPGPIGICDSLLKNEIKLLKDTIDRNKKVISTKRDSIKNLKRNIGLKQSNSYTWEKDEKTKELIDTIKSLKSKIGSIEREKTTIPNDIEEGKVKIKKFELRVYAALKYDVIMKLEKIGVLVYCLDDYNPRDGVIDCHSEDVEVANKMMNILKPSYPETEIRILPRPTQKGKGIIYFNSPIK